jgi:hypothetical protein
MINLKHVPPNILGQERPTKFTRRVVKRILKCLQRGMPLSLAANASGVSYATITKRRAESPKFAAALARAIARGADARLKKIEAASASGDWRASAWMLERCHPDHFGKSRLEVTGADGAPLTGVVAVYLPAKDQRNGEPRAITVEEPPKKELHNGR